MLDNVITLPVDELNNGTLVDKDFNRQDYFQNRSVYLCEDSTPVLNDKLTFYRTPHKVSGNFRGTDKVAFKFSKDIVVDGVDGVAQLTAPIILEVSMSLPIGTTSAEMLLMRQRAIALLDHNIMVTFCEQLSI